MTISLAGKQDKNRLDFIANNIYALSKEEYSVLPSTLKPDEYILDINTTRLIDPVIRVIISEDKLSALISFYSRINNNIKNHIIYINSDVDMRIGNLRFKGTIHIIQAMCFLALL